MKKSFVIWVVTPPGYSHSLCFSEVALCLEKSLIDLGHESRVTHMVPRDSEDNVIILGGNLLGDFAKSIPKHWVVYNLEQLSDDSPWLKQDYVDLLHSHPVWDYSKANIDFLFGHGISATHLPVGYHRVLTHIAPAGIQDIDVLFYGSTNERRHHIIDGLCAQRVNVFHAFNCYGAERSELISRAKIVLNMHFYEAKVFEVVRCSYLMANSKCIVSETGVDKEIEEEYRGGIAFSAYDSLVDTCVALLEDNRMRGEMAARGFEIFSGKLQSDYLRGIV